MNISTGLLFLGGHSTNPQLACALTGPDSGHEAGRPADAAVDIAPNPTTRENRTTWLSQSSEKTS